MHGLVEVVGLVERRDLALIGEQDVHVVVHQFEEVGAVAVNAEGVRQRQGHGTAGVLGDSDGLAHGLLGTRRVPQVALEVQHGGVTHGCLDSEDIHPVHDGRTHTVRGGLGLDVGLRLGARERRSCAARMG